VQLPRRCIRSTKQSLYLRAPSIVLRSLGLFLLRLSLALFGLQGCFNALLPRSLIRTPADRDVGASLYAVNV
jgi:hypothetical protein